MLDWLVSKIPDNVWSAGILAVGRHFVSTVAGGLAVWLLSHHASQTNTQDITEAFTSLSMALLSYGLSLRDVQGVDVKIRLAETTRDAGVTPVPETKPLPVESTDTSLPLSAAKLPSMATELPLFNKVNHPFGDL